MPSLTGSATWLLYTTGLLFLIIVFTQYREKIRQAFKWLFHELRLGLSKIARKTATFLQRMERRLSQNTKTRGDDLYEELTPQDNADEDKVYDQQLKWALGKKNIRNIAVTGTYGSGKSSVIKTFQKNHGEYRYLNISLASFPKNEKKTNDGGNTLVETTTDASKVEGQLVEFSILQQILLHIHHRRLPGSRFHRIRHQSPVRTFFSALFLTIFSFAAIFVLDKTFFEKLTGLLSWKAANPWENLLPFIFLFGFLTIVYMLLRIYSNSMISKFKIPAAELEVERKDVSVLNKQIEEILYFFEVTDYDVAVIEDLDRFDDPAIFIKLREINLLINNAQQVKRKVTFLYVLGDHVFKGESRTKFFDYIVPVIPVVNSSNSYQLLTDRIKKANLEGVLPDQFIDEVSLYINDMRLLKNIMNEFNLYYAKLKKDKVNSLNDTFLFSLVVYKNIYPEDFALLQAGKGIVVKEFGRKPDYINPITEGLSKRNEELEELIRREQAVLQGNLEQLRIVYLTKWLGMQRDNAVAFQVESKSYTVNQLVKDDLFIKARNLKAGNYEYLNIFSSSISTATLRMDFNTAAGDIDPVTSYDQKEIALLARSSNLTEQWKSELEKNHEEIRRISGLSLKDLLVYISPELISVELRNCRLLEFLLRSGYINEEYPYYISHFYPGSLLVSEHEFILSLKERKPKPYNYPLVNMPTILKRLYVQDYREEAVLNIYLLDYLLQHDPEDSVRMITIMQLLANNKKYSTEFIDQFVQSDKSIVRFVSLLSRYWAGWWDYIQEHPTATEDFKEKCFQLLLKNAGVAQLKAMNAKGYVATRLQVLQPIDVPEKKHMELLSLLPVKIRQVKDENLLTPKLMDHLYTNDLYVINPDMLLLLIRKKTTDPELLRLFPAKLYSVIRASALNNLIIYIDKHLDELVNNVLLKQEHDLEETEDVILELLAKEEISPESKIALIRKMVVRVTNLQSFAKEFWGPLFEENKVLPCWSNLLSYFKYTEVVDDLLAGYINRAENAQRLGEDAIPENDESIKLAQAIVNCTVVTGITFERIIQAIPQGLSKTAIDSLDTHKLSLLITHSKLPFDNDHLLKIRQSSEELVTAFLDKNSEILLQNIQHYSLEGRDYAGLLKLDHLSNDERFELILQIPADKYAYSPLATAVASLIIREGASVQFAALLNIVKYCSDKELSLLLAIRQLKNQPDVIDQLLAVMGEEYAALTQPDQKISFPNSANINTFISLLRPTGHITRVSIKQDSITVFTRKSGGTNEQAT